MTADPSTAPTFTQRREQTAEQLRANIRADAARAAEAGAETSDG